MFIGHFGVALAAKRIAPKASLGVLVAAASFSDVLWPVFLAAGVEQVRIVPGDTAFTPLSFESYPFSHSLLTVLVWAALVSAVYWTATRYRNGAIVVGVLVASHWFLDALVHRPDLPLIPGIDAKVGLGLWNSVAATLFIEGAIFLVGVLAYVSVTAPRSRIGKYGFWSFVAVLVAIYMANVFGPPPSVSAIIIAGLPGALVLIAWAAWFDSQRRVLALST